MDIIQDYALQAYNFYQTTDPYLRPIRTAIYRLQSQTYPFLLPLLNRAATLAQESPAILTVGVLLLFLLIAMRVLSFVHRLMMFWVRLTMRLMFWVGMGLALSVVLQRGVGKTAEDLWGWGQELGRVWSKEYTRWEGYQNMNQGQGSGSGSGYGTRRTNARGSWR